jgi:phospholipid/cholesterol/gamma-HCH transport system substrate-binding protein
MKISREFKVGLLMVVGITLLYFGFNFLKGSDFLSSSRHYYVFYENVDGLTESNQITLNGYAVGRVRHIEIQQDKNRVLVELDINSDIVVTDATVAMLNGELLGGRFIQLMINRGNALDGNDTLKADIAKGLMDYAEPVAANLQTTMNKVNTVLDGLTTDIKRMDTIFKRMQATPALLNQTLRTANNGIGDLSASFGKVANNVNGSLEELKPTLANFHSLSDSLKRLELAQTLTKAQQTLTKLNETLTRFNKGDNTMSKLMTEDTLYVNLNKLLLSVDSLSKHFNQNPRHFLAPLGKSKRKIERERKEEEEKKKAEAAKKN